MSNTVQPADDDANDQVISDIEGSSLFSDGDSDIDYSPADGYWMNRAHPQQIYVQSNPSETVSKGQAEPPAQASRPTESTYAEQSSTPDHASSAWTTERTALLDAGPAPPDYYAATARSPSHTQHVQYGSFSQESDRGQELVFSERAPQRMGDTDVETVVPKTTLGRIKRLRKSWSCMSCVNVVVIIFVIVAVVALALSGYELKKDKSKLPTQPSPGAPSDLFPVPPNNPRCSFNTFSDLWTFSFFSVSNFTLEEMFDGRESMMYELGGNVWIRPAPEDQEPDVRIFMSFLTHADVTVSAPRVGLEDNMMSIYFPHLRDTTGSVSGHCIDAAILVSVKRGLRLTDTAISTRYLHIFVQDGMFEERDPWLHVSGTSRFSALTGNVNVRSWDARKTIVESRSGRILGRYALRDLLSVHTTSGPITIDVEPKKSDRKHPEPAVLKAGSQSGPIRVSYPLEEDLPERDYEVAVENGSGAVLGDYIIGKTSFKTISGPIHVTGRPYKASNLTTSTSSGHTHVYVTDEELTLRSLHKSRVGSIELRYPSQWSGSFEGSTMTGALTVRGKGVEIDFAWESGIGSRIGGRKGWGDSRIEFETLSGSADLTIGET